MADFKLIVKKSIDHDEFNLKSTSTLDDMVRKIKIEYNAQEKGLFSLQNRFGEEFYNDEEENDSSSEMSETLESLFGNPNGAEITYVPIKAGGIRSFFSSKNSVVIWNALKKPVRCLYKYKIDNVLQTEKHHKGNIGGKVDGGDLGYERTIIQEKNGPDNKLGEFDILPRAFAEVLFEDQAIKGTVADCTLIFEDEQKVALPPSKKGKAFIIFKDPWTPDKFVAETSDYCRKPERFDWKTQTGKDLSKNVERPPRHNKK